MTWEYCRNNPKPFNGMKHSYSFTKPLNSLNRDASAGVPTFDCCVRIGAGSLAMKLPIAPVRSVVKPTRTVLTRVTRSISGSEIAS